MNEEEDMSESQNSDVETMEEDYEDHQSITKTSNEVFLTMKFFLFFFIDDCF